MPRSNFSMRVCFCWAIALVSSLFAVAGAETLPPTTAGVIKAHCVDCHDVTTHEGGLDLTALGNDLSDAGVFAKWERIFDRVADGEMPPKDAAKLSDEERKKFLDRLKPQLVEAHAAAKGTVLRRLNAIEYENTLNDLFGTHLKLAQMLPRDGRADGFETVGEALNVSMVQLQRYLEAFETVLDNSIQSTLEKPVSNIIRASYADTQGGEKFFGNKWLKLDDGSVVFFQDWSYPTGQLREANTKVAGWYKIRVRGYAYQSDEPITFSVRAHTYARGIEQPTFGYFSMPPGEPTTVELKAWIDERYMVVVEPFGIYDDKFTIKPGKIHEYKGPGLAITYVELEGPIVEEFPSQGHKLLYDGLNRSEVPPRNPRDRERSSYKPQFQITSGDPEGDVRAAMLRMAGKAFRRPVTEEDVTAYVELFLAEKENGASFEDAYQTAVSALFVSPDFLYFQESNGQLDDYALASRLSYFLTRTLPDEELLEVAASGRLTADPESLRQQTERLMESDHFQRFVTDFTDSWLNLREIEFTMPDDFLYPEYNEFLLYSMLGETRSYFKTLVDENLSIDHLVKSDFAMLNHRLAEHYEIEGVDGPEIRKVALDEKSVRGGLMSQTAVLKVSANGTNTSPVVRGVWVLERLMGVTPPPPPPGVPGLEPDTRGASTVRQLLAKHRDLDNCRACHAMIDPPGFALEEFDPIGGWRDRQRIRSGLGINITRIVHGFKTRYKLGPKVDASGKLTNGFQFDGYREFRDHFSQQHDVLTKTFVTKLLTFGTGRTLGFSDREEIDKIVAESIANDAGIRDLVHAVVQSAIFRSK